MFLPFFVCETVRVRIGNKYTSVINFYHPVSYIKEHADLLITNQNLDETQGAATLQEGWNNDLEDKRRSTRLW